MFSPYYPPAPILQEYQNQIQVLQSQLAQYQQANAQNQASVIDRVQGEASADIYPVQPGQEVILFDIDAPYVYRKARGIDNSLERHRYKLILDDEPEGAAGVITTEQIEQIVIDVLEKRLAEAEKKTTKKAKQTEEE